MSEDGIIFNGKPLKIKKKGVFHPVDVELKQVDGVNTLEVSAKINFVETLLTSEAPPAEWKEVVLNGIRDWGGNYKVFGDQKLLVKMNVEETESLIDSVFIICIDHVYSEKLSKLYEKTNFKKTEIFLSQGRSFATIGFAGLNWKSFLPRFVYLLDKTLNNYVIARRTARHEFGHVLGLGDLYKDLSVGLPGVDGLEYKDIEPYYRGGNFYNMVMCNNGPVRDNDIEMVLLAFQTNQYQNYQKNKKRDKISKALGTGN